MAPFLARNWHLCGNPTNREFARAEDQLSKFHKILALPRRNVIMTACVGPAATFPIGDVAPGNPSAMNRTEERR